MELPEGDLGQILSFYREQLPVIPRYGIPVYEAYSRFTRAMSKACILLRCKWPFGPFAFNKLID